MKKKLFSLVMAVAMIASLAVPALASNANVTGTGQQHGDVTLGGAMALPAVKVTLPTTGSAILNPYKMAVNKAGTSTSEESTAANAIDDQVLSAPHEIKNQTPAPMKVGIKIKATPSTGITMATKACTGKETDKTVFMFAELLYGGTSTVADVSADWTDPADVNDKCYPQIIASTEEKTNENFFTVPKATDAAPNYLYWTLRGNTALAPTGGWASTDKVDTAVTFYFTPTVLTNIDFASDNTAGVGVLEVGQVHEGVNLVDALKGDNDLKAAMGTVVRIVPAPSSDPSDSSKTAGAISSVEVKDASGARVTTTKVNNNLYYFTVPPTDVTVKISGTAAT